MITAAVIGAASGVVMIVTMYKAGMLAERSSIAVLLCAIAVFYPVFAVQAGAPVPLIAFHALVFFLFSALALRGFRSGMGLLAGALAAHGLFDLTAHVAGHPGPEWWPVFCGSLDLAAAIAIVLLLRQGRIAA